jgi:uncharacterized protein
MSTPVRELRLPTVELLRHPGTERHVELSVEPASIDVHDDRITGPVAVSLDLASTIDGVEVRGTVVVPWASTCRRCLRPVEGIAVADVDELYQERVVDPDAFAIEGDHLDLTPMVRELALLELPDAPLCRDDCAGICPVCGVDRNEAACDCDTTVRDERWSVLDHLRLDDP